MKVLYAYLLGFTSLQRLSSMGGVAINVALKTFSHVNGIALTMLLY